ncbi:MAG: SpoIIE family protein phosphatase [Candidatus Aminicenantes bacterium]|nr:SpoIIE family protein phosphatase [Candidatus Aminicenantes bacterium]MCK5004382.1 SpoIIE family protein phosphatase [Candidatus Aminicenantes bacterium]
MEEKQLKELVKELKVKKFQFNSIYEFSSSIYSSFNLENIFRIYFSTIMGHMGITRAFFLDEKNGLLEKRGFRVQKAEMNVLVKGLKKYKKKWDFLEVKDIEIKNPKLFELLSQKNIALLINLSEKGAKNTVLGLGLKFNRLNLSQDDLDFAFFLSRFALIAIENSFMISKMIEKQKMDHEINIAKEIQLSLLPQEIPEFKNFDIAVRYEPINSVGGDYYDILKERNGKTPVLIADVEGKGLSAALLAASSQAVFHSMNDLYFSEPEDFISKANSLIYDFTRGDRFITIFWMVIEDREKSISYVNAGHIEPILISGKKTYPLSKGGFLTGFTNDASYEKEHLLLKSGDVIAAFTDGVPEIMNKAGDEFGVERIIDYIKKHKDKTASELNDGLYKQMFKFSGNIRPTDDCTLIILKVK